MARDVLILNTMSIDNRSVIDQDGLTVEARAMPHWVWMTKTCFGHRTLGTAQGPYWSSPILNRSSASDASLRLLHSSVIPSARESSIFAFATSLLNPNTVIGYIAATTNGIRVKRYSGNKNQHAVTRIARAGA